MVVGVSDGVSICVAYIAHLVHDQHARVTDPQGPRAIIARVYVAVAYALRVPAFARARVRGARSVCKRAHRPCVGVGTARVHVCLCVLLRRVRLLPLLFQHARARPGPTVGTSSVYVAARACLRPPRVPACALVAHDCPCAI